MSKQFRVRPKRTPARLPSEKKNTADGARIGKVRILLILLAGTALVGSFYIVAMRLRFEAVFHLYWLITAVLLCLTAFLQKRSEYLYARDRLSDGSHSPESESAYARRRKTLKYLLLVLLPFLFTVAADAVYLLFLQDLGLFQALTKR